MLCGPAPSRPFPSGIFPSLALTLSLSSSVIGCAVGSTARPPTAIAPAARAPVPAPPGKTAVEERLVPLDAKRGAPTEFATLAQRMAHYDVPAVSIAVVHDGRIAWSAGYGVIKDGEPAKVDADTLFQAASISKPVADLATLVLAQRGVLDLDAGVNRDLRSWRVPESELTRQHPITLRAIMSHTAVASTCTASRATRPWSSDLHVHRSMQILEGSAPCEQRGHPRRDRPIEPLLLFGRQGSLVMEAVLVDVSQQSFEELMQETVLRPLAMTHSTFAQPLPLALRTHAARAHDDRGAPTDVDWHVMPMHAAAGLWTTAADLAKVIVEVQHASAGDSSARILHPGVGAGHAHPRAQEPCGPRGSS